MMNDENLSALLAQHAERHTASDRLRAAVQTQVALHALVQKPSPPTAERLSWLKRILSWRKPDAPWISAGHGITQLTVSFVAGALLTLALVLGLPHVPIGHSTSNELKAELLGLHVRSMAAGPLFAVASSDRHTVKPWFQGKLDYAPQVADLHEQGFELLGGRIERLQGRDTAVLVYRSHQHIISAYVLPAEHAVSAERLQQRGFNLEHWSDGAMEVWVLSDIDASELDRFGKAWRIKFAP